MPTAMSNCSLHNGIQHSISMKYQIESDEQKKKRMASMCYKKYLQAQSELPVGIEL